MSLDCVFVCSALSQFAIGRSSFHPPRYSVECVFPFPCSFVHCHLKLRHLNVGFSICLSPIATILHVITTRSPPVYLRYIHLIETIYSHARTARCIETLQCDTMVYSCQLPVIGSYVAGVNYVVGNIIGYTS